jgi:photosystem II stability/assembly factor-like uncharacterized protein
MSEIKRVKINHILDSQIPEFLNEESPLFKEFLNQYYISQEHQTGVVDLSDNLAKYKSIENFNNEALIDAQLPSRLVSDILSFEDTIYVSHTIGYPDKYGLLKIDDEIITYTSKTQNSFLGCIRGFSGIESFQKNNNPEFLSFTKTLANDHLSGSNVNNLNFIFFFEFFKKFKYHFLPGFEERNFTPEASLKNILSRAKDFYTTKGTDASFKILFKVLFGEEIEIIKPQEYMLRPSDNNYFITKNILVEKISGDDPLLLPGSTLYQQISSGTASASIYNVEYRPVEGKNLYEISLDTTSFINNFEFTGTTKVIEYTPKESTVINVDSTIGFSYSGTVIAKTSSGNIELQYTDKTNTQLLNVTGLIYDLQFGDLIYEDKLAYSYVGPEETSLVNFRVINLIGDVDFEKSSNLRKGDKISLSSFGKNISNNYKFTSWIYNIPTYHNIKTIEILTSNTYRIQLKDNLSVYKNQKIYAIDGEDQVEATVIDVEDGNERKIKNRFVISTTKSLNLNSTNQIKRSLVKASSTNFSNVSSIVASIQNTYIDKQEENLYIAFSGLPDYEITCSSTIGFVTSIGAGTTILNLNSHNFLTGDKIFYKSNSIGISSGIYFATKVDDNSIKLSYSNSDVFSQKYIQIDNQIVSDEVYKLGFENKVIKDQKLLKKFRLNDNIEYFDDPKNRTTFNRQIGVLANGVEIYSPTLFDENIYYGMIDSIVVTNPGKDYDVINAPNLVISDSSGYGCKAHLILSGSIKEIKINSPGIGYEKKPNITISGGNGKGAVLETNLVKSKIISKFKSNSASIDPSNETITFLDNHNFDDNEEVTYSSNENATIPGLIDKSNYFVKIINLKSIKLYKTKNDSIVGINTVNITGISSGFHEFSTLNSKNTITKIYVKNEGENYSNRFVKVSSDLYPNFGMGISGINTEDSYIFSKNHGFKNGDYVRYSYTNTPIIGLVSTTEYLVTVVDQNKFKLSESGIGTTSTNQNYLNKKYIHFDSLGIGTHTFYYPPIEINIETISSIGSTDIVTPILTPVVLGSAESVYIENGGYYYGSPDIINFHRRPNVGLSTISQALLKPVIVNGTITDVQIIFGGSGYDNGTKVIVYGKGKYADLKPIIENGSIANFSIVDGGVGYATSNTTLTAIRRGTDLKFVANVFEWKIDQIERNKNLIKSNGGDDETIAYPSSDLSLNLQPINFYLPRQFRKNLSDNILDNNQEKDVPFRHSPIVGWAYDGNPIYGPYGYASLTDTTIKLIASSYNKKSLSTGDIRPNNFPNGFFINDHEYDASGDLDEYNGRFCITPEYPYGTYAYFTTFEIVSNILRPLYPYIIGQKFKDTPVFENFDPNFSQNKNISKYNLIRNFSNYYIDSVNSGYEILKKVSSNLKQEFIVKDIKKSGISSIFIDSSGSNYSVNDVIQFANTIDGTGVSAQISRVNGKNISNLTVGVTTFSDTIFYLKENSSNQIVGITSSVHNFVNGDKIIVSGISTIGLLQLEGTKIISVNQKTTGLLETLQSASLTGIMTYISVKDTSGFEVNDSVGIGTEYMTVIGIVAEKSQILVSRPSNGGIHTVGIESVKLLTNKFEFFEPKAIGSVIPENKTIYFDPTNTIGYGQSGSTYSIVGIGTSTVNTRFVPSRSIYIPNHKYYTGQPLLYNYSAGAGISAYSESTSSLIKLNNKQIVYAVNFGDNLLGISTLGFTTSVGIGTTLNCLMFVYNVAVGYSHSLTTYYPIITGKVENYAGIVTTSEPHDLVGGDKIKFTILPSREENIKFRFDKKNKKITTDLIGFSTNFISIGTTSTINLPNNNLKTGDKVIYYSGITNIGGLVDKSIYYILKQNPDKIQLSRYAYDASVGIAITFTSAGIGTHSIALINPPLSFSKGNIITFDVSDSSLSNLRLEFYKDQNFQKRFEIDKKESNTLPINRTGIAVTIITNQRDIPNLLYYNFVPTSYFDVDVLRISYDTEVLGNNKIDIRQSLLSNNQSIIGIGSTSFKFNLNQKPEYVSYTQITGVSSVFYDTDSTTTTGSISKIRINSKGKSYSKNPQITSIASTTGSGAILYPFSSEIGKIISIDRIKDGFDYPTDPTIIPQLSVPAVCIIKDISRIDYVGILTSGRNYNTPPKLKVIGNNNIEIYAGVQGGSVVSVNISKNDFGLKEPLRIVPYNNSNGYEIDAIYADAVTGIGTIELVNDPILYPYITTGYGTTEISFPFSVGDKIFIEKCRLTSSTSGLSNYNSKDYGYNFFTVTGINTTNFVVNYTMSGLQTGTFGNYNNILTLGYVVNKNDMPEFQMILIDDATYYSGERVVSGSTFSAKVMENGWDNDINQLRLIDIQGSLNIGDKLYGEKSKLNGTVKYITEFSLDANLNVFREKINDFGDKVGFLNDSQQRISDNSYYQKFAYSIKSEVPYDIWKESVKSIVHPSGFKEFSDLNVIGIVTSGPFNLGIGKSTNMKIKATNPEPFLLVNIDNVADLFVKNNFAMVYEDDKLDDGSVERIYFQEGTALRSYTLNKTNKVYRIDDISGQFTGITTTLGGSVVGLTSFKLKNQGNPIFYKEFVGSASTIINIDSDKITLPNHGFQSGQEIIYNSNSGTKIGIATTSYASGTLDIVMRVGAGIGSAIYENGYNNYVPYSGIVTGISSTTSPGVFSQYFGLGNPLPSSVNSGIGTGALFQVLITYNTGTGVPIGTSIQLIDGGRGYSVGQQISIAGTYMGGSTPTNNLYFTVSKVSTTRVGTTNTTYVSVASTSTGLGTGAIFNITRDSNKDISEVKIINGGTGYASTDQIIISGSNVGGSTPADNIYLSPTLLGTNKLPSNIFVRKIDANNFQVSGFSTTLNNPFNLDSFGSGSQSFSFKNPNENVIISIDNIIQSPIHRKNITIGLSTSIGIGSTSIFISSGISSIFNNDILQIDNEYLKVNSVGVGSTNVLSVTRAFMGSVATAHTVGSATSIMKGDFNIVNDVIYFSTPPYGPSIASTDPQLIANSSFSGRVFSRQLDAYNPTDKNIILDDISNQFTGIAATEFVLSSNNQPVVGIFTNTNSSTNIDNKPFILINNIFQTPEVDYTIDTPNANTIKFLTGAPSAGKIVNVAITTGFGYQPLIGAAATVSVSAGGTISSIKLNGAGSGYRSSPVVSIASTVGSGASISAIVGAGGTITSLSIINGGIGYTNTALPSVSISLPLPYSNLGIAYTNGSTGNGINAKVSVQVGSGSSIIQFTIDDPGIGYKIGDVLSVVGLTTNPNIGTSFSKFSITVTETLTDKFSGFFVGQFISFDDISIYFNETRTKFTLTQTISGVTEIIDLKKNPGSDIELENNLFIYLNDILQIPNESYTLTGSRIVFTEPPKSGSKCSILFFKGSSRDVEIITPVKTIKEGDGVQIGENIYDNLDIEQFERIVKKIVSSDQLDTYNYDSIGINTDTNKQRPLKWIKQKQDRIINGSLVSKARPSLISTIRPTTKLIKNVNIEDTSIYVNNAFPLFTIVDSLPEEDSNILIIENRDTNPAIATAIVSIANTISSIAISTGGIGYAYTSSPRVAISSVSIQLKDPILNWSASSGISTNTSLLSVTYGSPIVSVGQSGVVAITTDAKNYNLTSNVGFSKTVNFNSIAFASTNTYIAVGDYGKIVTTVGFGTTISSWIELKKYEETSLFGVVTRSQSSYISSLTSVDYFSDINKWISVGYNGAIFSAVGVGSTAFIKIPSNTSSNFRSIAYGASKLIIVGDDGTSSTSTDGTFWNTNTIASSKLNKIIWDGSRFVVVGDGNIILTSLIGDIWAQIIPNITGNFVNIDYNNTYSMYTLLDSTGNLYYSFDLQYWTYRSTNQLNTIKDILYISNNDGYVLVGTGATSIYSISTYNLATAVSSVTSGIITSISIQNPGFGYNKNNPPKVLIEPDTSLIEQIFSIKAKGDFGTIVGVDTSLGFGTTLPQLIFRLKTESYDNTTLGIGYSALDSYGITYSGISTGDYFVIYDSNVQCGHALTGITTTNNAISSVGTANTFIDGVYRAENVQVSGVGIVTVFCKFLPGPGYVDKIIVNANPSNKSNGFYGRYSWSKIYDYQNRGIGSPNNFTINTNNGLVGLSSAPEVTRTRGLFKGK